jgi:hypothetical protein
VLSIDKKNLAKSIQSQYGNIDTNNYLRRFIDLEFDLKNPSIDKFCDVLCQKFELDNILENKEISTNGVNEGYGYGLPSSISFNISAIEFLNFSKVVFSF